MAEENEKKEVAKFDRRYGTRDEVWAGTAEKTKGGLTRDKLTLSRNGRLVSKVKSEQARANYKLYGFKKRAAVVVVEEEKTKKMVKPKKKRRKKKKVD
jgi:hypothetical protein